MITVVIPTLLKDKSCLDELLNTLIKDEQVTNILVINNSEKEYEYNNSKVEIKSFGKNIFVNPAWNYGVNYAKTKYVALLNDDIKIPAGICSAIIKLMDKTTGIVGISPKFVLNARNEQGEIIKQPSNDYKLEKNLMLKPTGYKTEDFGVFMIFDKSDYVEIPPEFEVYYGDDWIFNRAKENKKKNKILLGQDIWHYGSLTSYSMSNDFIHRETKFWKNYYSAPWYKRIFSITITARHYDCYILGIHLGIKRKYK